MLSKAYWVNPKGKILDVKSNHIAQIIADPKTFGITRAWIDEIYANHNEKIGTEGEAREEIILKVLESGFIRVRQYKTRWSLTLHKLDVKTRANIKKWALIAKDNKTTGKWFPVKLNIVKTDKMIPIDQVQSLCETVINFETFKQMVMNDD